MIEPQSPAPGQTVFYGVLLAGSGLLLWEAWKIEGFGSLSGPGMFPMIAAGLMVVTVLIMMVKVRRNRARSVDDPWHRSRRSGRQVGHRPGAGSGRDGGLGRSRGRRPCAVRCA